MASQWLIPAVCLPLIFAFAWFVARWCEKMQPPQRYWADDVTTFRDEE